MATTVGKYHAAINRKQHCTGPVAAKPNKAKMQAAPRMPQTAAISATQASIALTAVTAMATGSEGAETGVEESAAAEVVAMQLPVEVWAAMSHAARQNVNRHRRKGARKQGALDSNSRDQSGK